MVRYDSALINNLGLAMKRRQFEEADAAQRAQLDRELRALEEEQAKAEALALQV
jgi:hypothetical protein